MSPAQTWPDPDAEAASRQRAKQSWDRILAARATATQQQAQAVSTMAANYPHMRPGTVVPLAQANVAPEDPLAQHVATQEAKGNKKKRGVFGAIGDVMNPVKFFGNVGEFAVDRLEDVGGAALAVAKPALRGGLAAAAAPFEVATGAYRNVAAASGNIGAGIISGAAAGAGIGGFFGGVGAIPGVAVGAIAGAGAGLLAGGVAEAKGVDVQSEGFVNPLSQSALFQSFGSAGLGQGYMPGGTAQEKAAEAARRAAAIGGHALTPGRFLASSVVEEGTAPYNLLSGMLDASTAWKLDPTAAVGKGLGRWRQAQREFVGAKDIKQALTAAQRVDAGLVDGARKTVLTEKVDQWLTTEGGSRVLDWFADADFETIRRQLGGNKVDVGTVKDLANAKTRDEALAILRPKLGLERGLELKPRVGTRGMEVKRWTQSRSRLLNELPSGHLDYADATEATHQYDLLLRDANIPADEAARFTDEFAGHLLDGSYEGRRAADRLVYQTFGSKIEGVAPQLANKIARRAADGDELVLKSLIDGDATKTASSRVSIGGKTQGTVSGGFLAEHIDNGFDIDRQALRDIRNTTSRFKRVLDPNTRVGQKFATSVSAMDGFTNNLWKPTALLRGAWTVRVVGEEQIRMAATGNLSVFNHPLAYLAWAIDDDKAIAGVFKRFGMDVGGRGGTGFSGEAFAREGSVDELEAALRGRADEHIAARGMKQQAEGWHDGNFVQAKHTATYTRGQQGHVEAVAERLDKLHSDPVIRRLAEDHPENVRMWFTSGEGNEFRQALIKQHGAPLATFNDVDRHLTLARKNLDQGIGAVDVSAGNPALREVVSKGELNGVPLRDKRGRVNKDFLAELKKMDSTALPDNMVGSALDVPKSRFAASRDKAVETMYTNLMSRPSAKLSRSPMFRQTYWDEAEDLITEVSPETAGMILANAEKAKLPKDQVARLRERARLARGDVTLAEADHLAKGRALDATMGLLYDSARKGQLADTLRIIMPFASAQKEVMSTWAKLGVQTPQTLRRAQQIISGARGSGAFFKDPTSGEEMFMFPGSEFVTDKLLGMPIPLTGRVQGLNMFGSGIMPGVGPAVQIPARWIIPDKPQFDDLNKFLDPFGTNATEQQGIIEQQLPGWFTKIKTAWSAPESDRVFANTIKDVWAQGISAGRYSTETPEEVQDGLDHAKSTARWLYFIRGISSVAGSPTPPSPQFMAMDKDGKWQVAKVLAEDYRQMIDDPAIGFEKATAAFVDKYGANAAAFMQAKTYTTVPSAPSTTDFSKWARGNEAAALKKDYGEVYALFGPQGEGFDYQSYLRNIKEGDTVSLTPQQFVEQANNRVAQMVFHNFKDRFGPSPSKEQRAWLTELRTKLRDKYPGYDKELPGKYDQKTVKDQYIPAIEKAVADPTLEGNDVAAAARIYLAARTVAQQQAVAGGYSTFAQAKAAAPLRDWLRQIGEKLAERTPDFAPMYERVFDREMISDDTPEAAVA